MTRQTRSSRPIQQGMALLSAIFILVVLALIGAFAVHVSTMQHVSSAQDVQSVRAYQAARAGIEWALYQVQTINGGNCAGSTNLTPAGVGFTGLTVTVTCTGNAQLYQIAAVACNQPAGGSCPNEGGFSNMYIERRLEVKLRTDTN
ncbi:MAG: hypothetical protein KBD60_02635 [Sterolibacterium sp.]|jgi:MSHA biogenesis protein MshP|nr:hypothetical protein [Sterolibacterium sp.]